MNDRTGLIRFNRRLEDMREWEKPFWDALLNSEGDEVRDATGYISAQPLREGADRSSKNDLDVLFALRTSKSDRYLSLYIVLHHQDTDTIEVAFGYGFVLHKLWFNNRNDHTRYNDGYVVLWSSENEDDPRFSIVYSAIDRKYSVPG